MLKIILLFLLSFKLYSAPKTTEQVQIKLDEEIDNELDFISEIDESEKFQYIDDLHKEIKEANNNDILLGPSEKRPDHYYPISKFYAVLKQNSVIENIENNQLVKTNRQIYVVARSVDLETKYAYILNKDGNKKYKTIITNLIPLKEEATLYPNIDSNKRYLETSSRYGTDSKIKLENNLRYHLESINVRYFADLLGKTNSNTSSRRIEYRLLHSSFLPIDYGLTLSYQSANWIENEDVTKWKTFYYGPVIKYSFTKNDNHNLSSSVSYQKSYQFSLIEDEELYQFAQNVFEVSIEGNSKTVLGSFDYGLSYRKLSTSIVSAPTNFENYPIDRGSTNSFALYLGLRYDIEL